uniref:Uncharacterized protein n=1 Tax=Pyrodinium bahamense TaxID=73915 RepID=A0A7S0FDA7_9DINO|mmetsp:Transcript_22746/g.63247  ORF Transcript_22746/g.63247 Transcript_22746/m.63247 type:complete len:188 (+) Transcript_22746:81-644(+)|eukprot:CAMPEP_0179016140 /NCGR_PEP_ID=MMETSP0796-20121207/3160_1 /TAXON_ID=73915 /ORGANISM="Pyrodinium bahamense, Strain pbaha01" /LENGTH=187 /DNA_ID=CAMNT_0020711809 /DNA_START=27 /DNA_END=590 /DNA_ORIENTATION=+
MILTLALSVLFLTEIAFDLCFDWGALFLSDSGKRVAFDYYCTILSSPHIVLMNTLAIPFAYREGLLVLAAAHPASKSPFGKLLCAAAWSLKGCLGCWGWRPPQKVSVALTSFCIRMTALNVFCGLTYLVVCRRFYLPIFWAEEFRAALFDMWWIVLAFRLIILVTYRHHVGGCSIVIIHEMLAGRRD